MWLACFLSTQPSVRPAFTQTQRSAASLERADLRLSADGLGYGTVGFIWGIRSLCTAWMRTWMHAKLGLSPSHEFQSPNSGNLTAWPWGLALQLSGTASLEKCWELSWTGTTAASVEHLIHSAAKSWDIISPNYFQIHCSVINSYVHTGSNSSFPPALFLSVNS